MFVACSTLEVEVLVNRFSFDESSISQTVGDLWAAKYLPRSDSESIPGNPAVVLRAVNENLGEARNSLLLELSLLR